MYNYGLECKKFNNEWICSSIECYASGMSDEAILELHDYLWDVLKGDRVFYTHTQSLECSFADDEIACEYKSPLINKQLEKLSVSQPEICEWDRLAWIDDLETPELAWQIKLLGQSDLELLSYIVVDKLTRAEIARELNITRSAITQKFTRIKKVIEKAIRT